MLRFYLPWSPLVHELFAYSEYFWQLFWRIFSLIPLQKKHFSKKLTTASLAEMGGWDVQGFPPMAQPAPRQSYTPMAGKPTPSTHEPPRQWNQAPVTMIYQWKNKGGRDGGKRMIQRRNKESGCQENAVLSTCKWCKQSFEPNNWLVITPSLLVVSCVK